MRRPTTDCGWDARMAPLREHYARYDAHNFGIGNSRGTDECFTRENDLPNRCSLARVLRMRLAILSMDAVLELVSDKFS